MYNIYILFEFYLYLLEEWFYPTISSDTRGKNNKNKINLRKFTY